MQKLFRVDFSGAMMKAGHSARIDILQILRLFAASMIILYHSDQIGDRGSFGVQIFFVISGFLACYTTSGIDSSGRYLLKRCIRLLPLYWIFTALTFLVLTVRPGLSNMSDGNPLHFLYSLLFIPYVGQTGAILPILAVGWSMQYELAFTLFFALSLRVSRRWRVLVCSLLLLGLTCVGLFLKPKPLFLNYYTDSHFFVFFLGLAAGVIYRTVRRKAPAGRPALSAVSGIPGKLLRVLLACLAAGAVLFLVIDPPLPFRLHHSFRFGIPAFVLVLSLVLLADHVRFPSKILALCNMTYSIYLVEYFTTSVYKRLLPGNPGPVATVASLPVLFAVTFAVSVIPYRLIEVRLTGFLRRRLLPARPGKEDAA